MQHWDGLCCPIYSASQKFASNFTNAQDAFGIISYTNIGNGEFQSFVISADVAGNQIKMQVASLSNGTPFQNLVAILQYVII